MPNSIEKRIYKRVNKEIPISIRGGEYDIVTLTTDISASGVYCKVDRFVAPFTKIQIVLELPIHNNNEVVSHRIQCVGVVVRVETEENSQYRIAIYFTQINEDDRKKIEEYVNYHL